MLIMKFVQGHDHTLSSVQYSKLGDQVITCGRDQMIKCWEVATGYCVRTLSGHSDWVKCLSLSIDGELIASGGHDQSVVVWRFSSGQKLQVKKLHRALYIYHKISSIQFFTAAFQAPHFLYVIESHLRSFSCRCTHSLAVIIGEGLRDVITKSPVLVLFYMLKSYRRHLILLLL